MASQTAYDGVPAPRGWLFLAFLGVLVYLVSQLLQAYAFGFAEWSGLAAAEVLRILGVTSGLGSLLVLSGLITALWRANLAAGLSPAGVRGLVLGASGVGVLGLFEFALLLELIGAGDPSIRAFVQAQPIGGAFGNALALAGLASLAVGLGRATSLFGRPEAEPRPGRTPEP
jgi:hypothetical protein